jgi:hypothetical protein
MVDEEKDKILTKVYFDPAGYGSINQTLKEAKAYDNTITYDYVKSWIARHTERKTNLSGFNSFIAHAPHDEYQMDLMFFTDLKDPVYIGGLLMIDIFTKYTVVVPTKTKQIPDVAIAIKHAIDEMGAKPQTIYSDNEGAFVSNEIQKWFKDHNIRHLTTLSHAPVAERQIRTIKNMIYKRYEREPKPWHELLYPVLLTYNNKLIHSTIKMTPSNARKSENHLTVKLNLELSRKHTRKYPEVKVGDMVRVYRKKDKLDKEHISTWGDKRYKVNSITETFGQNYYHLDGYKQNGRNVGLLRHDILLTA